MYKRQVKLFAGDFAPEGWLYCDGKSMSINDNTALFSILRTQYGGDGKTTFSLPNMKPVSGGDEGKVQYIICIQGVYPARG